MNQVLVGNPSGCCACTKIKGRSVTVFIQWCHSPTTIRINPNQFSYMSHFVSSWFARGDKNQLGEVEQAQLELPENQLQQVDLFVCYLCCRIAYENERWIWRIWQLSLILMICSMMTWTCWLINPLDLICWSVVSEHFDGFENNLTTD